MFLLAVSLLAFPAALFGKNALAATPNFTFTANNVTMSSSGSSGTGTSSITLTSVDGYAGTVGILCAPPTLPAGVKVPVCNSGGAIAYSVLTNLTANQTATGTLEFLNFLPPCNPCPVSLPRREEHGLPQGLALAGALVFGFGFWPRARRRLTLTLLAVGALVCLMGIGACGGGKSVVTPGTYPYTLTAVGLDTNSVAPVTTSISVTVP
jgi:hypothetical protein